MFTYLLKPEDTLPALSLSLPPEKDLTANVIPMILITADMPMLINVCQKYVINLLYTMLFAS